MQDLQDCCVGSSEFFFLGKRSQKKWMHLHSLWIQKILLVFCVKQVFLHLFFKQSHPGLYPQPCGTFPVLIFFSSPLNIQHSGQYVVSAFPLKYPAIYVTHILFIDPIMVYISAVDFKTWRLDVQTLWLPLWVLWVQEWIFRKYFLHEPYDDRIPWLANV